MAAPVPLHSSLYSFPQAKVSEGIWFACLRCRIYIGESPEGLWSHPGSAVWELLFEEPVRLCPAPAGGQTSWWFSARGRSGCGKFIPLALDSPDLRHVLSHGEGKGL